MKKNWDNFELDYLFSLQGVANAADLSGMVDYLTELGIKHNRYGAEDEYFDVSTDHLYLYASH